MNRAREGSVKNLQELYTVAVGVALAVAIEQLVRLPEGQGAFIKWEVLPTFGAFLVTLVPFYHGALRHLDQRYVEERGEAVRDGALLADFFLLFLEACLLLGTARVLPDARAAAWGLAILLVFDALWGGGIYLLFTRGRRKWEELEWVRLNLVAGPLLMVSLLALRYTPRSAGEAILAFGLPVAMLLRSVIDYRRSWAFYFPWHRR